MKKKKGERKWILFVFSRLSVRELNVLIFKY